MADLEPEDNLSEAEEEMAGTSDPATDGEAEEEEAEDEEQIPQNLHGYWQKSHVKDSDIRAMESEGTVAPQAESGWRTDFKALVPLPNPSEIVMPKFHVERGSQYASISFLHESSEILWVATPPHSTK
jgi:hypothetical protein